MLSSIGVPVARVPVSPPVPSRTKSCPTATPSFTAPAPLQRGGLPALVFGSSVSRERLSHEPKSMSPSHTSSVVIGLRDVKKRLQEPSYVVVVVNGQLG